MNKLLLVEDSRDCYEIVNAVLEGDFQIQWVKRVDEAIEYLNKVRPHILLLDVMLPDGSGYDVLSYFKKDKSFDKIPVLMLTGKSEISDKVFGFTMGADDYLCKPFEPLELKMRVMARMKDIAPSTEFKYKNLKVDVVNSEVKILLDEKWQKIDLTSTEYKILNNFIQSPEKIISREDILNKVWGEDVHLFPRIVDTYISRLRKKIESSNVTIISKNRLGYELTTISS